MAIGPALILTACLSPSVRSQTYTPVVEDRVESMLEQQPLAATERERRDGWDLGAVISAAYDDNIFLSAEDPESDLVFRAAPKIAYAKGDEEEGEGGFVNAGYVPTLVIYASNGDENRVDHQAFAVAGWRGKVTRLTYTGAIRKLGDATPETGSPVDRIEFGNEIRAAWLPREKVALEVAAGNRQSDYDDSSLNDSSETYGEVAVRYIYSPKTQLGIVYRIGRLKVDRSDDQDVHQLAADVSWEPRRKIRLDIKAGAEHRDTGGGSEVNPVLEGRLAWSPREGTDLYLTGYMREEASAFYSGQNYSVRGFSAGISQRFNSAWSATLDGGYERNRYRQVSGGGSGGRTDSIWFIRPALVWQVAERSDVSFFVRISDDDSSDPAFGYERRIYGVELNHTF
jgi:hypothetical protein